VVDGGGADAGEMDGGASDAGVVDSGGADTAPADAAGSDAGPIDADADGGGGADSAPADAAPDTGGDALGEPPVCGCENSGGVVVGPACWFLSESNQSCAVLCSSLALVYDEATRTYAGSSGSFARDRTQSQNCGSVLDALGVPEGSVQRVSGTNEQGVGCHYDEESSSFSDGRYFDYSQPTSAEAAYFGGEYDSYRACACACP
jgi:hypothetical protein